MKNQDVPCVVLASYCEEGAPATVKDLDRWAQDISASIRSRRFMVERTPEGFLAWHPAGIIVAYENPVLDDKRKVLIRNFEARTRDSHKQQRPIEYEDMFYSGRLIRGYLIRQMKTMPLDHGRTELLDEDLEQLLDLSYDMWVADH